jgi:hypothetical protein
MLPQLLGLASHAEPHAAGMYMPRKAVTDKRLLFMSYYAFIPEWLLV